jgi:hypothetical protein
VRRPRRVGASPARRGGAVVDVERARDVARHDASTSAASTRARGDALVRSLVRSCALIVCYRATVKRPLTDSTPSREVVQAELGEPLDDGVVADVFALGEVA